MLTPEEVKAKIAAQIEEAVEEGKLETKHIMNAMIREGKAEGFRAATEKVKGIVEAHRWDRDKVSTVSVIDLIAQRIGEMEA